jgi:hypothetical protein
MDHLVDLGGTIVVVVVVVVVHDDVVVIAVNVAVAVIVTVDVDVAVAVTPPTVPGCCRSSPLLLTEKCRPLPVCSDPTLFRPAKATHPLSIDPTGAGPVLLHPRWSVTRMPLSPFGPCISRVASKSILFPLAPRLRPASH